MRKIKFRVWDKQNQIMTHATVIEWSKGRKSDGSDKRVIYVRGYVPGGVEIQSTTPSYTDRVELMQFTGLKDVHDREIYEGDILGYGGAKSEVKYDEQHAVYHDIFGMGFASLASESEIVANIYENSELLAGRIGPHRAHLLPSGPFETCSALKRREPHELARTCTKLPSLSGCYWSIVGQNTLEKQLAGNPD